MSFGTVLCLALAVGFVVATIYFAVQHRRARREYDAAVVATTLRMSCDLSKAGEYRGKLRQDYGAAHGLEFYLAITPPAVSEAQLDQMMRGFVGKVVINDSAGRAVYEDNAKWEADSPTTRPAQPVGNAIGSFKLARLFGGERGEHEFVLKVISPAGGMAGRTQELTGRYEMCGLERLPAAVLGLLAFACGVIAAGFGVMAALLGRRAAKRTTAA